MNASTASPTQAGRRGRVRRRIPRARSLVLAVVVATLGWWISRRPSNDRDWTPNLALVPHAEFGDSLVRIYNVRNTAYTTAEVYTPRYDERVFDLREVETVWFVVEPFSRWGGAAHTFLSFGFAGAAFVSISVEARRERDETYGFVRGLFRQYELIYVVADERDAIGLRANHRGDDVYLYPIRASRDGVRRLFVSMLERANELRAQPAFYNTLLANCTNTIVRHVNLLLPDRIPPSYKTLLPGYADRLAYDLGLIDTELPFEDARRRFRINRQAARYADSVDFSARIREP